MVHTVIPRKGFTSVRVMNVIAMILTFTGVTWDMSPETFRSPNPQVKIAMLLYLTSWFILCLGLIRLVFHRGRIADGEYRNLFAVAISVPFLLIRIVYGLLIWFKANNKFNGLDGKGVPRLFMVVLQEIVVVFVCLFFGVGVDVRERYWRVILDENEAGERFT